MARRNFGWILDAAVAISAANRLKGTAAPGASRNHSSVFKPAELALGTRERASGKTFRSNNSAFLVPVCQPCIGKAACLGQLFPGHVVGIEIAEKRVIVGAQRIKNVIPLLGLDAVA